MSRHDRSWGEFQRRKVTRYLLFSLLIYSISFEAISLFEWILYPSVPNPDLFFAQTDFFVFKLLAPLSVIPLIVILYFSLGKIVLAHSGSLEARFPSPFRNLSRILADFRRLVPVSSQQARLVITDHSRVLLVVTIAFGILLVAIPYRPELNPTTQPVGVDAHWYVEWVSQMVRETPADAVSYAMGSASWGSRPLLLIPMYVTVSSGLVTINGSVVALPFVLSPLLALSAFIFVREGTKNEKKASIAALFSMLSFTLAIGMWAGFYTNWLAICEVYLFLAVLLRCSKLVTIQNLVLLTLGSLAILLTHPWTWLLVVSVSVVFALSLWKTNRNARPLLAVLVVLAICVSVDVAKMQLFGASTATQDASLNLAHASTSDALGFWTNVIDSLFFLYSGLFANAVILAFSLIAVLRLKMNNNFHRLLAAWLTVSSIPFAVLPALLQTRIIYDLPIPILTAMGTYLTATRLKTGTLEANLLLLLIILTVANYTIRVLTSIVTSPF